jgi:hypothetical protein
MPAEFDHVEMGRRSYSVDKNQIMLGPVKRSHAGIGLVQEAEVQALARGSTLLTGLLWPGMTIARWR